MRAMFSRTSPQNRARNRNIKYLYSLFAYEKQGRYLQFQLKCIRNCGLKIFFFKFMTAF